MKLRTQVDISIFACLFVAILWFLLLIEPAEAGGPDIEQTTTIDNAVTATGGQVFDTTEQTIGGNKSDAFAIGLGSNGAAAIDDCLYTVQAGFGAAQWVKPNKICLAEKLDQMGKHQAAAKMRCTIDAIQRIYPNKSECQAEMLITPKVSEVVKDVPRLTPDVSHSQLDEQRAIVSALKDRLSELEQEVAKREKRRPAPPQKPTTIIQRESFLTDEKRAALAAIRGDE